MLLERSGDAKGGNVVRAALEAFQREYAGTHPSVTLSGYYGCVNNEGESWFRSEVPAPPREVAIPDVSRFFDVSIPHSVARPPRRAGDAHGTCA